MRPSRFQLPNLIAGLVIGALATLGGGGCASRRAALTTYKTPVPEAGVVFVADGAFSVPHRGRAAHPVGGSVSPP